MRANSILTWLIGLPLAAALAVAAIAFGGAEPGHMPLHVGCKHHNHGPKWHADHGRILGVSRGLGVAATPESDALLSRSVTAGRPSQQARGAGRD